MTPKPPLSTAATRAIFYVRDDHGVVVQCDRNNPDGQFDSLTQWECKARSWLGGISGGGRRYKPAEKHFVCIDAKGRRCRIGADFMRADAEKAFPVTWHCYEPPKKRRSR